jgi:hypothetical protein
MELCASNGWFPSSQSIMIGIHAKRGHALSMEEQVFPRTPNGFSRLGSARNFLHFNFFTVFLTNCELGVPAS